MRPNRDDSRKTKLCTFCKKLGRFNLMNSHTIADCWMLSKKELAEISKVEIMNYQQQVEAEAD